MKFHSGKPFQGGPGGRWLSGPLILLAIALWAILGTPTAAQDRLTLEDSYERIYSELYPEEVAPFYNFYAKLTAPERFALARVIASLDEGEWGLFAALLMDADEQAAFKTLQMFGSYDDAQLARATREMKGRSFERWQAIPALLAAEPLENARAALLGENAENACRVASGDDPFDASSVPNTTAARVCSLGEEQFLARFYGKSIGYVTQGVTAQEGEIPWQVQLALHGADTRYYRSEDARRLQRTRFGRELKDWEINHSCGAAYLGARFVLTAAHCIGDMDDRLYFDRRRVHLGSVKIDAGRNLFKIRKVLIHADYNSDTLQNDIALIELERVPTRLRYLRSVALPPGPAVPSGQVPLVLSGWGFSRPANRSTDIWTLSGQRQIPAQANLKMGTVWVQQISVCKNNRNFRLRGIDLYDGQLCVGSPQGVDSCRGDSGGPLVDERTRTLIGIVSGSASCGLIGTPSVFADVGYYRDWIDRAKAAAPRLASRRKHKFP